MQFAGFSARRLIECAPLLLLRTTGEQVIFSMTNWRQRQELNLHTPASHPQTTKWLSEPGALSS